LLRFVKYCKISRSTEKELKILPNLAKLSAKFSFNMSSLLIEQTFLGTPLKITPCENIY
jgi:hypothetical protein